MGEGGVAKRVPEKLNDRQVYGVLLSCVCPVDSSQHPYLAMSFTGVGTLFYGDMFGSNYSVVGVCMPLLNFYISKKSNDDIRMHEQLDE